MPTTEQLSNLFGPRRWTIYSGDETVEGLWSLSEVLLAVAHYRKTYGILLFYLETQAEPVLSRGV